MTIDQAIAYIHSVCWKNSTPGLGRTQELLRRLGDPQNKLKFVHIAGTNGKGSTAAMTASILQKAGYRVGLFTSPFLYRFQERMQVNGIQIADDDLIHATETVRPFAEAMPDPPTEFELIFCIAMVYFQQQHCDIVVLEVGMGGALDATNAIQVPEVAVITNIGLDHTAYLGNTLEEIAETKAGIFKQGGQAVVYRGTPGVEAVFDRICAQRNVTLHKADFDGLRSISHSLEGQRFDCGTRKDLFLPLLGGHQMHNAAVVLSIVDVLISEGWGIPESAVRDGLRDVRWPGRFDILRRDPLFIVDGGHNPQCIQALTENITDYLPGQKPVVLTGVLADKDYADMYRTVLPFASQFVCVTPPSPRALDAADLAKGLVENGGIAMACATVPEGVCKALELAGPDGVVLCFGSLYLIGAVKDALDALNPSETK